MKRKVKVILTAAIFTFCTAIGGCKAVESKLEPVYEALLQEDSVQEEKSVQASENQEMSTKEDLSEKSRHLLRIRKRKRLALQLSRQER